MFRPGSRATSCLSQGIAAGTAAGAGLALLKLFPSLPLSGFAAGAARLASLFTGQPVLRIENGWMLPDADLSIVVTEACSATDFWLMLAALIAGRLGARTRLYPSKNDAPAFFLPSGQASLCALFHFSRAALCGLAAALPLAILLNALRVVVVAQAHRWFIDRFPPSYGPFLHMATGVAIFLPSLIALNVLLDLRASRRSAATA